MHAGLTDLIICPQCGPSWGLVLLADRVVDRRILSGTFGCPNCRASYAIEGGVADLRTADSDRAPGVAVGARGVREVGGDGDAAGGPRDPGPAAGEPDPADREAAVRLAALLGLGDGGGVPILIGSVARFASTVAALVDGLEVVAADGAEPVAAAETATATRRTGVSRIAVSSRLPFRDGSLRGVALGGGAAARLLEEGVRVLASTGHLVVEDAPEDAVERLERAGLAIVANEGRTIVARRV